MGLTFKKHKHKNANKINEIKQALKHSYLIYKWSTVHKKSNKCSECLSIIKNAMTYSSISAITYNNWSGSVKKCDKDKILGFIPKVICWFVEKIVLALPKN